MTLIRSDIEVEIDSLRERLAGLDTALGSRAAELAQLKADLDAFRIRYRQDVGQLHDELDNLECSIAEAELDRMTHAKAATPDRATPSEVRPEPAPRFTSDAIRKLFRDVAKIVHPDLARDDQTRDRRHALMAEANRAYALGDVDRLRGILDAWSESPEAVPGSDPAAVRERLTRRVAEIEAQLQVYSDEIAALQDSPLWRLKSMVDEAAAQGRDLIADMVRRLKRDIMVAHNRLDAILWRPG